MVAGSGAPGDATAPEVHPAAALLHALGLPRECRLVVLGARAPCQASLSSKKNN